MNPIDYSGMSPTPDFAQSIGQGLQIGAGFQQLQQRRAELEKAQLAAQRTAQFRNEVGPALQAGDPAALVQLFGKYPDFGDQIKQASGFLNDADENNKKTTSATVYNGLQSGNVDIAKQALESRVNYLTKIGGNADEWKSALDALNSGDPDKIGQVKQQATLMHALYNPTAVKAIGEIRKDEREQALQPSALRTAVAGAGKAEADAATAAVKAKYADSQALQDLEKTGWDIKKIKADIDIAKESNRIAAMNAAANREGNGLKRQELQLKIDDALTARDTKVRDLVAKGESEVSAVTDMKGLLGTILGDEKSLRAVTGFSAWKGSVPGTVNRSVAGKIEQLNNMLAATNLDKIVGAMSDKDIAFVKNMSANLDRYQDEDVFIGDLKHLQKIADRTEAKTRAKYGIPEPKKDPAPPSPPTPGKPQKTIEVDY